MKPVDLVAVFVRLLAVLLALNEFSLILQLSEMIRRFGLYPNEAVNRGFFMVAVAVVLAVLATAAILWRFALRLARFIVPKEIDGDIVVGFSAEQLEVCLLSLLGMSVLIDSLPQLARLLMRIAAVQIPSQEAADWFGNLVFWLIKTAAGAFLLLRSAGIRKFVHGLRRQ